MNKLPNVNTLILQILYKHTCLFLWLFCWSQGLCISLLYTYFIIFIKCVFFCRVSRKKGKMFIITFCFSMLESFCIEIHIPVYKPKKLNTIISSNRSSRTCGKELQHTECILFLQAIKSFIVLVFHIVRDGSPINPFSLMSMIRKLQPSIIILDLNCKVWTPVRPFFYPLFKVL